MIVDVAIVGGGPAGCSAALTLLARGLSVAVFSLDSKKSKPTETAAPTLKAQLRSLGAEAALDACWPCFGIESNWGRNSPYTLASMLSPHGNSWFVERAPFDAVFKKLVKSKGVIWVDACIHDVHLHESGVSIEVQGEECKAKYLIAANGSPFWTARLTSQTTDVVDSLVAFWAIVPSESNLRIFSLETSDFGWWYVCPRPNQTLSVCLVTDGECAQIMHPNKVTNWSAMLAKTKLKRQFLINDNPALISSAVIYQAILPQRVGSNWIVAGDAAHKLDPLGSAGTAAALASGQRAARAVADALNGNSLGLTTFQSSNAAFFSKFTAQREWQYSLEARRRPKGFWLRRSIGIDNSIPSSMNSRREKLAALI